MIELVRNNVDDEKDLATCTPTEFFIQTNKIRKFVAKWLTDTDILNIRKRMPNLEGLSQEEKKEALDKQAKTNISDMLDAVLEAHPEETVQLMALVCFIKPEDANKYPMIRYIKSITKILNNEDCLDFFKLLVRLAN